MHRINGLDLIERQEQLKSSKPTKKSWNFVSKTFLISQLNLKIYEDADVPFYTNFLKSVEF